MKLLVDNKTQLANDSINRLRRKAKVMLDLIDNYHSIKLLPKLTSVEDIREFLQSPLEVLERNLLSESKLTISGKQVNFEAVLRFYSIDLTQFKQLVIGSREPLEYYTISIFEETGNVDISVNEKYVQDKCKLYLSNQDEICEYQYIDDLCKRITEFAHKYNYHNTCLNATAKYFDLNFVVDEVTKKWTLKPNLSKIKQFLFSKNLQSDKKEQYSEKERKEREQRINSYKKEMGFT